MSIAMLEKNPLQNDKMYAWSDVIKETMQTSTFIISAANVRLTQRHMNIGYS